MAINRNRTYLNKVSLLFLGADMFVISLVYVACVYLLSPQVFETHFKAFLFLFIVLYTVWLWSETSYKLYTEDRFRQRLLFSLYKLFQGVFFIELAAVLVIYLRNKPFLPNDFILLFPLVLLTALLIERVVITQFVLYLRKKGFNIRHVILLGGGENAMQFYKLVENNLHLGYNVLGYFDEHPNTDNKLEYLGTEENLDRFLHENHVNEIIIAYSDITTSEVAAIICSADRGGIRVRIIPNFHFLYHRKYEFWQFGSIPTFTLRGEPLEKLYNKVAKRLFDVVFSAFVLLFICSWLLPLIAILIRLNSKGPILFKQKRLGRDRKEFECYKFRSMYVNDNADKIMATKGDARITPVGKFLRKTSLDEFPQFWNVFVGDMSIVGPRPHMSLHNVQYQQIIDNYMVRQLVRPGITGWAQVNGYRGEIKTKEDIKKRVEYDIWYLENWSFGLDIKIILLTVLNVIRGEEKAY